MSIARTIASLPVVPGDLVGAVPIVVRCDLTARDGGPARKAAALLVAPRATLPRLRATLSATADTLARNYPADGLADCVCATFALQVGTETSAYKALLARDGAQHALKLMRSLAAAAARCYAELLTRATGDETLCNEFKTILAAGGRADEGTDDA